MDLQYLKLSKIKPDKEQPRQYYDNKIMERLKNSIKKNGILNPLIVEKQDNNYLLIDGERRYRCAKQLKLNEVPVHVLNKMTKAERGVKRFQLQEQQKNWTTFEKGKALVQLKNSLDLNIAQLARLMDLSQRSLNNLITVYNITKDFQNLDHDFVGSDFILTGKTIYSKIYNDNSSKRLEEMLQNLINKKITAKSSIRKLNKIITEIGDKTKKYFNKLNNSSNNYTFQNFIDDTGYEVFESEKKTNTSLRRMTLQLQDVINNDIYLDNKKIEDLKNILKRVKTV